MVKKENKLWVVTISDYHDEPSVYLIASRTERKAEQAAIREHKDMYPGIKRSDLHIDYTHSVSSVPSANGGECKINLEPVTESINNSHSGGRLNCKDNAYKGNLLYEAYLHETKVIAECDEINLTKKQAEKVAIMVTQSDGLTSCLNKTIRDYIKEVRANLL